MKTRTLKVVTWCLLHVACCLIASGCTSTVEQDFHAADCKVISLYLAKAQPAVEAYCEATGDEQLRTNSRALAAEMVANISARLDRLKADRQAVDAALAALDAAMVILDEYELLKREEADNGITGN